MIKFFAKRKFCSFSASEIANKKNHYDTLGVKSNSNVQDIKKAYYKLAKIHHPDLNKSSMYK